MKLVLMSVVALCLFAGFGCSTPNGVRRANVGGSDLSQVEGVVQGQGAGADYRQILSDPGPF